MNKNITVLLLAVILAGMGMVVFFHTRQDTPTTSRVEQAAETPGERTQENLAASPSNVPAGSLTGQSQAGRQPVTPPVPPARPAATAQTPRPAQPGAPAAPAAPSTEQASTPQPNRQTIQFGPPDTPEAKPGAGEQASAPAARPEQNQAQNAGQNSGQAASGSGAQAAGQPSSTAASAPTAPAAPAQPAAPEQASAQEKAPNGSLAIRSMSLHFMDKGMVLRIKAESPLQVKAFALGSPDRMVVDVPGKWNNFKAPSVPSNNLVSGARVGRQGNADRLVLDLKGPLKKNEVVKVDKYTYEVRFE